MKKLLFLVILFCLAACGPKQQESASMDSTIYDYGDIEERIISWGDILNKEGTYYTYVYSEGCGHCKEIKQVVLKYAIEVNRNFYFILFTQDIPIIENDLANIGVTNYQNLGICGTPTLFEIDNHIVSTCYTGSGAIIKTLTRTYE